MPFEVLQILACLIVAGGIGVGCEIRWAIEDHRKAKVEKAFRYTVVEQQDVPQEFSLEEFQEEGTTFSAKSPRDAVQQSILNTFEVEQWDHNSEINEGHMIVWREDSDIFTIIPWTYEPSPYPGANSIITIGEEQSFSCPCTMS